MSRSYDAVLLIGFGGPISPEEVRPFLSRVSHGHAVAPERLEEVARHYEAVGGRSPLNEITYRQARSLEEVLRKQGFPLPIYVGMRHSRPFLRETLDLMIGDGVRRALGFILSPHQTEASWERYQKNVAEAHAELGDCAPDIDYCPGWHAHPLFIEAWVEQIQSAMSEISKENRLTIPLILTAHSVPVGMAARSPYVEQTEETARLLCARLGHKRWSVAYQSRSGCPEDPWLEPDVKEVIRGLAAGGAREVVVAPIGFVSDHVEVLYDLDIEARNVAGALGMRFIRASSLNDHPTFIRMMAEVIEASIRRSKIEDGG